MIGNLILNRNFKTGRNAFTDGFNDSHAFLNVRLFCKQDSVDDTVLAGFSNTAGSEGILETFSGEIEKYRILALISGKKVFLQARKVAEGINGFKNLSIPFEYVPRPALRGWLYLSENNLKSIFSILGHQLSDLEDFLDEAHVSVLEKILYRKLSGPPPNFSGVILSISDRDLQLLLNHMLHKNIASPGMLASYVYDLGDEGHRITDNLSRSVRMEVIEKAKLARLKSSYRWAGEVKYIIHRNIYTAAKELDISIRGMEALDFITRSYEISAAKHLLQNKSVAQWLEEFDRSGNFKEVLAGINRKILVSALTFADWNSVKEIFKKYISGDGVERMKEDIDYAGKLPPESKYLSLARFYRRVKDIVYSPAVGTLDFEKEVISGIPDGDAIDLIVDEIGFAKVVYALKNMPGEWVNSMLKGPLRDIYEDVLAGRIKIKKYDDYRINESRREFLKMLLILRDEEKI